MPNDTIPLPDRLITMYVEGERGTYPIYKDGYTKSQMHAHAAAVTAAKDAEIARLTAERDAAFAMSRCECATDEACAELAKLRAEVAGLRADAERYRYIRDDISIEHGVKMDGKRGLMAWWTGIGVASGSDEHIDAAIDAARKGTT